jgi:acyl-CoA reductase-like NAD-dependent aldehyde dehydrogenase
MFVERASKLRTGAVMAQSPEGHIPIVDMGAMINTTRFNDLRNILSAAANLDDGAQIDVGGEPYHHAYHEHGSYFKPTVVGDPDPQSAVAQTERELHPCLLTNRMFMKLTTKFSVRSSCAYSDI